MKKTILNIEGMTCSACSLGLEKYLNKQDGIKNATVNLVMAKAFIEHEDSITRKELDKFVKEAGFKSFDENDVHSSKNNSLIQIIIFSVLSLALMYISMGKMVNMPIPEIIDKSINQSVYITIMITVSTLFIIWGLDIIKNGIKNIVHGMPNMDSLVGLGVIVNYLYSFYNSILIFQGKLELIHSLYFESSAMIILFIKIGRYIDIKNKAKAVEAIKGLVTITPKNGNVIRDGKEVNIAINEITKGDIVVCRPGEKIAVDGVIIKGSTHTDETFLTGESKPVGKEIGSTVMAGSINYDGYIEYKAERIGKDSSISHIVDLVVEATNSKAPIARIADKISSVFVPSIFIVAFLSFLLNLFITHEVTNAMLALVSVLVVACPCALGLATPLAMVVSIGNCSRKGILIKSSESLEAINKIDTIVFDKTGTLTKGELSVVDRECSEEKFTLLKNLESKSSHPLAKSICKGENSFYEVLDFEEIAGMGVKGIISGKMYYAGNKKYLNQFNINNEFEEKEKEYSSRGDSIVYFWNDDKILGIIGLADEIKDNMKDVIENLKSNSKKPIMLTGDNELTAKTIAKKLGIDEVYSDITPKGKLEKIQELNEKHSCAMIGDGINDSPALKTATVGVSVANGSDISSDSADVIMLSDDMRRINDLFEISKKTIRIIKQNLFWALFYNICMIPLATGLLPLKLNPMIASLAMTISSLTVVLNSLRLRK